MAALYIVLTVGAGSLLKGATGSGLPLIAMPVLSILLGVPHTICVVAVPMALTNAWQLWQFRGADRDARFLPRFLIAGALGIGGGTWLLVLVSTQVLALILGLIVLAYLGLRFHAPHFRIAPPHDMRTAAPVGLVTGLFHGATGFSGAIGLTYMNALRMPREVYIFSVSAMFLSFSALQIPLLFANGVMTAERFAQGVLALLGGVVGMPVGAAIGKRMSAAAFDRLVLALLAVSSVLLLWEGMGALM